jgi:hypothetical protein
MLLSQVWGFLLTTTDTGYGVANDFVAHGVPKEDIVLAFHAPYKRPYTGFGTGKDRTGQHAAEQSKESKIRFSRHSLQPRLTQGGKMTFQYRRIFDPYSLFVNLQ